MLSPYLPFTCEQLHQMLGYDGQLFGEQHIEIYRESERTHDALTYAPEAASGRWEQSKLQAGQALRKPKPLFKKLDEDVIEDERARLGK